MSRSDYDNGPEQRTGGAERPGLKTVVGEWGRAVLMRNWDRATIIAEREQASSGSGWEWGEQHRRAEGQPIDHVGAQRRRWGSGCGGGIGKRCQKMGHSRARAGRVGSEAGMHVLHQRHRLTPTPLGVARILRTQRAGTHTHCHCSRSTSGGTPTLSVRGHHTTKQRDRFRGGWTMSRAWPKQHAGGRLVSTRSCR